MNNKALKTLEYTKIIEMLAAHASSPLGKIRCEDLLPSCSPGEIEYKQEQTQDALSRLFQKGNINFGSAKDIRGSLKRLEIGSTLGITELLQICALLDNTSRVNLTVAVKKKMNRGTLWMIFSMPWNLCRC